MANLVAKRAVATFRPFRTSTFSRAGYLQPFRSLHSTTVVYKKKGSVAIDDLFSDSGEAGDLFKDELSPKPQHAATSSALSSAGTNTSSSKTEALPSKRKRLSPDERRSRYDALLGFIKPRLGRKPEVKMPQVRNSAWVHLVGLATTKEQLHEIAELFPAWKSSGRELEAHFSELFVRRCEELSCPHLALDVFGNYAKYNLKLTLGGARQLLHSLHVQHPIDKVITASALYDVYSLPPISQDLVSCTMVVSACFKHNSKDSLKVARSLVPHLQKMVGGVQLTEAPDSSPEKTKGQQREKAQAWLRWSLKKVDKALFSQTGSRAEWLRDWRMRNGHILEPTQF